MKKILLYLMLLIIPFSVSAKEYSSLDITVDINNKEWYVFTRDNIKDNKELKELGITEEYMNQTFESQSMYIDSVLVYDDTDFLEFMTFAKDVDLKSNLHKYEDSDLTSLKDELIKKESPSENYIYKSNGYKYIYTKYVDSNMNVIDYYTVINGKGYTLKFQKQTDFTEDDYTRIKSIIDSVKFNLNDEYEKDVNTVSDAAVEGFSNGFLYGAIAAVVVAIAGIIIKKKKDNNK